jgi:hypothetical protein
MSEITQEFVVSDINSNIIVETNDITITPNTVELAIYTGSSPVAAGSVGQLQYNNNSVFGGVPNTSFSTGNLSLGNLANVKISGGANAYFLQTDGTGNLVWAQGTANVSGNGTAAGANTQIQISDGTGNFTSAPGFTFDASSNIMTAPGNGAFAGNVSASYFIGNGAFLTGLDTSIISNGNSNVSVYSNSNVAISVNGTANVVNISNNAMTVNGNVTANIFTGNLYGTANTAVVAGTVTTAAQPNITSVGNLTSLTVAGNLLVTNNTTIQQAFEKVDVNANAATGTIPYYLSAGAIQFRTANASANFTLNLTYGFAQTLDGVMSNGQSITCSFINTNGANAYIPTNITVDGSAATVLWSGSTGSAAPGTINGKDLYTFNIVKNAGAFTVFSSRVGFV